ncbi:CaiB/BaiF CoA-transferase family protein [Amphritea sp. 2_MG-2023]|uniref:CaiB/BaiF CoA transferase family protein n=1 Tax=Amphritea TaxID=515417 RepID=UPI001C079407|nr:MULTISPECIES: CaiB/BaiF CoA-transferase family protein [Amphritea]MBU2965938.1 CoA transferase [Amphritea atlantica]MDO6418028.1 CaiB/BaiF CoA-transferase family protein [Amphritea sp. 2_MG-2023]
MAGALSHIKVLDLSRILAGPWAGQMLADFGAQVIKVERPGCGDDTRSWGPPYMKDAQGNPVDAAYFHAANRGKQSIAIDITTLEGQALIKRLAAEVDVVIENYKVGGLKKYSLDYDSLKSVNPALIYCSITGFGQDGPYAERAGYDFMIQAMGGLMSVTGEPDGQPMKVGVALVDVMTGLYACNAIQAALLHRRETGVGQYIDMALLDVQVATLANQAMNYLASDKPPARFGNAHPNIVPYEAFPTADGHIILAVGNDGQFAKFCALAGAPELATNPAFETNSLRVENRDDLTPIVAELMTHQRSDWWLEQLSEQGVPCGPINTLDKVFADPQVKHRQLRVDLPHPVAGSVASVANPVKFSQTPIEYNAAPPMLGQHTDEVLAELGLSEVDIAQLKANNVVG